MCSLILGKMMSIKELCERIRKRQKTLTEEEKTQQLIKAKVLDETGTKLHPSLKRRNTTIH